MNHANNQNNAEHRMDMVERGLMTAAQANVQRVRDERFVAVTKLIASVRKALNDAVKSGELAHMKKEGFKPEVYYHPQFKHLDVEERNRYYNHAVDALSRIYFSGE